MELKRKQHPKPRLTERIDHAQLQVTITWHYT